MKTVYFSTPGSFLGGGPSVWVAKMTAYLTKLGYSVIFDKPEGADVAICIISAGKVLRRVDRNKTKVILRIDGIYNKIYNDKFHRPVTPDMEKFHRELKKDILAVDHVVYQSQWSFDRIEEEIVHNPNEYSIIHNGCDTNLFKPAVGKRKNLKLIHVGKMRDAYLMRTLAAVSEELGMRLLLVGSMDGEFRAEFKRAPGKALALGNFKNTDLGSIYSRGDIYLDLRQGASCNNVVAEAQSCGLPVITSSWGGGAELVQHAKTGMIVDGGKWDYDKNYVKNIANAVQYIMGDAASFKNSARQHAVKNLSLGAMVDKYKQLF